MLAWHNLFGRKPTERDSIRFWLIVSEEGENIETKEWSSMEMGWVMEGLSTTAWSWPQVTTRYTMLNREALSWPSWFLFGILTRFARSCIVFCNITILLFWLITLSTWLPCTLLSTLSW